MLTNEWFVVVERLDGKTRDRWHIWRPNQVYVTDPTSPMYLPESGCSEERAKAVVAYMQPTVEQGDSWKFHALNREEMDAKLVENLIRDL